MQIRRRVAHLHNRARPYGGRSTGSEHRPDPARLAPGFAPLPTGNCWDTRTRCKPATTATARPALTEGIPACPHCRPDKALGILDRPTAPP
ncbi:DUF6233 domain-containing protein [Streptomyces sp. NPDC054865]